MTRIFSRLRTVVTLVCAFIPGSVTAAPVLRPVLVEDSTAIPTGVALLEALRPRFLRGADTVELRLDSESRKAAVRKELGRLIDSGDEGARIWAARLLVRNRDRLAVTVSDLRRVARNADDEVRVIAAVELAQSKPMSTAIMNDLHNLLTDRSGEVVQVAAWALAEHPGMARRSMTALIKLLEHDDFRVRESVMRAIGRIEPGDQRLTSLIKRASKSRDWKRRIVAARLAGYIGTHAREAISALRTLANDQEPQIREISCLTIGGLGPIDGSTKSILWRRTIDDDRRVRESAWDALKRSSSGPSGDSGSEKRKDSGRPERK